MQHLASSNLPRVRHSMRNSLYKGGEFSSSQDGSVSPTTPTAKPGRSGSTSSQHSISMSNTCAVNLKPECATDRMGLAAVGQTALGSLLRRGYENSMRRSESRKLLTRSESKYLSRSQTKHLNRSDINTALSSRNYVDHKVTVTPPPHLGVVHEGPGGFISDSKSSVVVVDMDPLSGGMDTLTENNVDSDLVFINCSGFTYVTTERTLKTFPKSILGDPDLRSAYWSEKLQAYYFDRHRGCFESILQFYQTRREYPPPNIDLDIYHEEKDFWKIPRTRDTDMEVYTEKLLQTNSDTSECFCCLKQKLKIHRFLVNPTRTIKSSIYHAIDILMICIATVLFISESEPSLKDKFDVHHPQRYEMETVGGVPIAFVLFGLNATAIAWFTMDIIVRMVTWPIFWDYWKEFMNILDIFSVFPFYIELIQWFLISDKMAGTGFQVLRILRLIRVVRVFKFVRHSESMMVILKAVVKARNELTVLFVSIFLFVITFGAIMFFLEEGVEPAIDGSGPSSPFSSILMACWWVLVSVTTVGFGDMYPTTTAGKFLGSVVLCLGIICLALPMTIIVTKFSIEFDREKS